MRGRMKAMTVQAARLKRRRNIQRVALHTPEGMRLLNETIERLSKDITRESAIAFLMKTGMYDSEGQLKPEYR